MLWHDGRELSTVEAVRRLIESTVEARHASLLSGAGAGQRNGAACWEEWLGFQKGRVGTAPNEPKVFGDDVVEGYKAWVVRARQVSARTADMYLNDLNRVFRGCLRAMGQPHEVMDRQTLRDLCVERWELVGQEAANQKSKSVDQGLNYLKRYMRLDEDEIRATVDDEGLSASGSQVQALGEAVLEGFSVWLHENTSTRQSTWNGYGRAVEGLIADVLKSEEKEGTVLEADTVRDFVTQHREALEERGAADARPYVGAGVRYFLRFLGLIEPVDVEEDVVDKDEEEVHVSERKTEGEPRGMARLSAARASRRNSDRLPLNTELADQFAYYLVKQNGMKEGTAVEYIRYVGAWINDLVEMEGVDPPAAGSLDRASTMEFISGNEGAIRDYGRELKKAAKKGKVSAW
jgi:site-specific recombinase XerC